MALFSQVTFKWHSTVHEVEKTQEEMNFVDFLDRTHFYIGKLKECDLIHLYNISERTSLEKLVVFRISLQSKASVSNFCDECFETSITLFETNK